jgi:hypothetical protein
MPPAAADMAIIRRREICVVMMSSSSRLKPGPAFCLARRRFHGFGHHGSSSDVSCAGILRDNFENFIPELVVAGLAPATSLILAQCLPYRGGRDKPGQPPREKAVIAP